MKSFSNITTKWVVVLKNFLGLKSNCKKYVGQKRQEKGEDGEAKWLEALHLRSAFSERNK